MDKRGCLIADWGSFEDSSAGRFKEADEAGTLADGAKGGGGLLGGGGGRGFLVGLILLPDCPWTGGGGPGGAGG